MWFVQPHLKPLCICSSAGAMTTGFGQWVASAADSMQQALIGFFALVGVLTAESAIGEVLLFSIRRSAAAFTACVGQWVPSAAAGMQQRFSRISECARSRVPLLCH